MKIFTKKTVINAAVLTLIALVTVTDGRAGAKIITALAKDYLRKRRTGVKACNERAFRSALSRLKKDQLVKIAGNGLWKITNRGREQLNTILKRIKIREENNFADKSGSKKIVFIFDIPEKEAYKRRLLRTELKALDFEMVQKSVWVGSAKITKTFLEYLRDLNILSYVRIFSAVELGTLLG